MIEQYEQGASNAYFKNLPVAISLFRSVIDQVNAIGKRMEKIEVNQTNYILNETQILAIINKDIEKKQKEQGFEIHPGTGELINSDRKKRKSV